MPLPSLTPEQRAAALAKIQALENTRIEVFDGLRSGERTLADVLTPDMDELVGKLKVVDVLLCVRGQNPTSVEALMERLDIGDARRLRGLTIEQREALLDAVD